LGLDKTAIMDSLDLVRCVMIPLDQNYYCTTILFIWDYQKEPMFQKIRMLDILKVFPLEFSQKYQNASPDWIFVNLGN
jgi:hypothetical protein